MVIWLCATQAEVVLHMYACLSMLPWLAAASAGLQHALHDPCMCALQQVGANAALALLLTVGTNLLGIFTM